MAICGLTLGNCAKTWLLPANGGHGSRVQKAAVLTAKLAFGIIGALATLWARSARRMRTDVGVAALIVSGTYVFLSCRSLTILTHNACRQH